jgi:hypothetical protein
MNYELLVTDSAWDRLMQLIDGVPENRRDGLLEEIERELRAFCASPAKRHRYTFGRPTVHLDLQVDGVTYYWAAVYQYGEDERSMFISDFFRRARM